MIQTICARCKGLVVAAADEFGPYIHCVSCGRLTDLRAPTPEFLTLMLKKLSRRPVEDEPGDLERVADPGGLQPVAPP